jgi:hypothetical protein
VSGPKLIIDEDGVHYVDGDGRIIREYSTPPPCTSRPWGFLGRCDHDEEYHELLAQRDDLRTQVEDLHFRLSVAESLIAKLQDQ